MRITAGDLRGRVLPVKEKGVRPTSSKTREAIFNIIGSVEGFRVLNLYAGTGIVGFEAVSRGCGSVVMVDISNKLIQTIKETALKWKISDKITCIKNDVMRLEPLLKAEKYDFIFADPPFDKEYPDLRCFLSNLNANGFAIFEMPSRNMPFWANDATKIKNYGESCLAIFR